MPTSSRFAVAVHVLATLALRKGEPVPSELIAKSASTNPAVIRRLLSLLSDAGITRAQLGKGGGTLLARPAEKINLLDVYRSVENEELFALHRTEPDPRCPVGRNIQPVLQRAFGRAISAMDRELAKVTIAAVARSVKTQERRRRNQAAV